tara:strand:+ start:806 stop:1123 length:318 start_codon:yes stop_codon:yes gene_type:complete
MMFKGTEWSDFTAGTDSGATATQAAATGKQHFVTGIYGFVDADSALSVKAGSSVVAEWAIDVSVDGGNFSYTGLMIPITPGSAANGVLAASSADCGVTLQGFTIP